MKKINQIIHLLFLSVALFSSSLLAQQNLGTSNKYKIGTSDSPVLAPEYKDFLNNKSSSDRPWIESSYYDSSFMNASNNWSWQNNPNAAIYRTGTSGSYSYSVISGHENDIIDAVYSQSIQQEFNGWRAAKEAAADLAENPTRQELCDYINDKIAGHLDPSYLDKATEIQNKYPQAAGWTLKDFNDFSRNADLGLVGSGPDNCVLQTLWQQVDDIVNGVYGTDTEDTTLHVDKKGRAYTTTTHTSASDPSINNFITRWGLVISEDQDASLAFPANMPKHVVVMDGSSQNEQAEWGHFKPVDGCLVGQCFEPQMDVSVTTKVPCAPPAPDNGDTPATQN